MLSIYDLSGLPKAREQVRDMVEVSLGLPARWEGSLLGVWRDARQRLPRALDGAAWAALKWAIGIFVVVAFVAFLDPDTYLADAWYWAAGVGAFAGLSRFTWRMLSSTRAVGWLEMDEGLLRLDKSAVPADESAAYEAIVRGLKLPGRELLKQVGGTTVFVSKRASKLGWERIADLIKVVHTDCSCDRED